MSGVDETNKIKYCLLLTTCRRIVTKDFLIGSMCFQDVGAETLIAFWRMLLVGWCLQLNNHQSMWIGLDDNVRWRRSSSQSSTGISVVAPHSVMQSDLFPCVSRYQRKQENKAFASLWWKLVLESFLLWRIVWKNPGSIDHRVWLFSVNLEGDCCNWAMTSSLQNKKESIVFCEWSHEKFKFPSVKRRKNHKEWQGIKQKKTEISSCSGLCREHTI